MRRLQRQFFDRPTSQVAQELLGKYLVRRIGNEKLEGMITEVEAYIGQEDLACHASKGRTKRTEVMFGPAGHAYIYMIYGMYFCLNIVTEREGYPAAVLIRGIRLDNNRSIELNGPGKVCRYFQIDKMLNAEDVTISNNLWIEDRGTVTPQPQIKKLKRIGIDYAKEYKDKLWRFLIEL